jgi:hypothetical protein
MNRSLLVVICLALAAGCQKRVERAGEVFQSDDGEYVLTIVLDMSSSFREKMAEDGQAWSFVCQVIDKYFRDRIGHDDKLIVAQLSASDRALLWYGTPLQLRQEFSSGVQFREWLASKADPSGSHVYGGIVQAVEYALADPIVASGKGKSAVFILSDMVDNSAGGSESHGQAVSALVEFAKRGGVIGLYYVDVRLCSPWNQALRDAGVPVSQLHVEADIVGRPVLPSFE